jgi:hypothetical protein
VDDEVKHLIEVRKAKIQRLHELDKQAATFGPLYTPPYIEMERGALREELGMVETAIKSPARAEVSEELGASGRFQVNYQQNREIRQSIASLAVQLETFIAASLEWRTMHRTWILIIGLVVILILVAVVALVTYTVTRAGLAR